MTNFFLKSTSHTVINILLCIFKVKCYKVKENKIYQFKRKSDNTPELLGQFPSYRRPNKFLNAKGGSRI